MGAFAAAAFLGGRRKLLDQSASVLELSQVAGFRAEKPCADLSEREQLFALNFYLSVFQEIREALPQAFASGGIDKDSLRFYNLGNNYSKKVIHIGIKPSINVEGDLII